jgi:hypothetical protein
VPFSFGSRYTIKILNDDDDDDYDEYYKDI